MSRRAARLRRLEQLIKGDDDRPMYVEVNGDDGDGDQVIGPVKGYIAVEGFHGPSDWPQAPDRGRL